MPGKPFFVDTKQLKKYEKKLLELNKRGLPHAAKAYTNDLAFDMRWSWQAMARSKMELRSKYTERSIRVDRASGLDLDTMSATVGSTADYMDEQEYGATETKKGTHGVPIPAAAAGKRGPSRRRTPKRKQLAAIKLSSRQVQGTGRGVRLQALKRIAAKGGGHLFMRLSNGNQGIYHVRAGKKKLLVRKVWDLTKRSVTIPENPTMEPAAKRTMLKADEFWGKALQFQLMRLKFPGRLKVRAF